MVSNGSSLNGSGRNLSHNQLAFDGSEVEWEKAGKPRHKKGRKVEQRDMMILGYLKLWDHRLTAEEVTARLEKLMKGMNQDLVEASLYRLWKQNLVWRYGHPKGTHIKVILFSEEWLAR